MVITGKGYGFVTFSTSESVEQLLEMKEPLEVAGSKVILRQVIGVHVAIFVTVPYSGTVADHAVSGATAVTQG